MSGSRSSVSIVTAAYNAASTIGAAVTGALDQRAPGRDLEVVVVDDGSDDHTAAICAAYGEPVTLVRQVNAGTAAARNAGISAARGDWIVLCDADDALLPGHVTKALAVLEVAPPRSFATSNGHVLSEAGVAHGRRVLPRDFPAPGRQREALLRSNFVSIFATFPKQMWEEIGGFDPSCPVEDWDLWLRAVFGGWCVVAQPEPTALYRWSADGKSTDHARVFRSEDALLAAARERYESDLIAAERDYLDRRLASRSPRLLTYEGDLAIRTGDLETARRSYAAAGGLLPADRKLILRRLLAAGRPGAAAFAAYLRRIDATTGRDPHVFR